MFESMTYLGLGPNQNSYYIIDTEFEVRVLLPAKDLHLPVTRCVAIIKEYKKRDKDIIHNIYLCNMYIEKTLSDSFYECLELQNKHIDKEYPELNINFSKEIYPKLLEKYKKYKLYV